VLSKLLLGSRGEVPERGIQLSSAAVVVANICLSKDTLSPMSGQDILRSTALQVSLC